MRSKMRMQAAAAIAAGCYPVFLLWTVSLGLPGWIAWIFTGAGVVAAIAAQMQSLFLARLERSSPLMGTAAAVFAAVFAGTLCSVIAALLFSLKSGVAVGILITAVYFGSWLLRHREPEQLVSISVYALLCTVNFLVLLYVSLRSDYSVQGCFGVLLLVTLLFGSLRSTMSLYRAAPEAEYAGVPKRYVRHNLKLYGILSGIGLVLALFGKHAVQLLHWLLLLLVKAVIRLFVWLGSLGSDSINSDTVQETTESIAEVTENSSSHEWLVTVLEILWLLLLLLLLYRLRHRIAAWFRTISHRMVSAIRHIFRVDAEETEETLGTAEYADYVQLLPPSERETAPKAGTAASWKKQYRRFRRISDSEKQFRFGYALWLSSLELRNVEVEPSDTPDEIREKARKLDTPKLCDAVTEMYYPVRYAHAAPTAEALGAMQLLLEQTAGKLRNKK